MKNKKNIENIEEKSKCRKSKKDVLTPVGDLSWKTKADENNLNADEMFNDNPIAGSAGVEC